MFEAVEELIGEHADLEKKLADPSVHADQANARKLNKRYAELTPIVSTYRSWKRTGDDIGTAREFAADDPDFAAEVKVLEKQREQLGTYLEKLRSLRSAADTPPRGRRAVREGFFRGLTLQHGIAMVQAEVRWLEAALGQLQEHRSTGWKEPP